MALGSRIFTRRNISSVHTSIIKNAKLEEKNVCIIGHKYKNPLYKYLIVSIICLFLLITALMFQILTPEQIINGTTNATKEIVRATI